MKLLTLRNTREFHEVYSQGRKIHSRFFTIYCLAAPSREFRYGLTVSRRIGTHVIRNKVRRRLRDIIHRWAVSDGRVPQRAYYRVVVVAKERIVDVGFGDLQKIFSGVMERFLDE